MDPMDFTMDDSSNVLAGPTLRFHQCQQQPSSQPHPQTNGSSFAAHGPSSQGRDSQHYDPVHESSAWYQHNHTNYPQQSSVYPISQSSSQWSTPQPESAATHNWPHFTEMERRNQDYNSSEFRPQSFLPWSSNPSRYSGLTGYAPAPVTPSSNGPTEPALQFRTQGSFRGYDSQQQYLLSREMARANIPPQSTRMFAALSSTDRTGQATGVTPPPTEASTTTPLPGPFPGFRSGVSRASRPHVSRTEDIQDASRRRRQATSWDSDDDEESLADLDRMDMARRHAAEALFGGDFDDERSIAALRGAVAGGKRVPSKEALDSLETVKVADLKDADRTCIICYNEFGVCNPEGEIENPIRLPKCKHIFGDKCIKKWFEDSDSCPYCRDKLPSELAVRKSLGAYQSYRLAHREQMRLSSLAQRSRYSSYTPAGISTVPDDSTHRSPSAAQRAHEEYEYMLARQNEYLNSPRNPNADSPERRRQARGRHSAIRGPHFLSRPTSVGSVRASNPSFTHPPPRNFADLYSPRRNAASETAAARETREARDRENRANILPSAVSPFHTNWDQNISEPSAPGSANTNRTPQYHLLAGASVPREEASPPVAVGSGVSARRQVDQRNSTSRLSVDSDNSDPMFDSAGNPSHQIPNESNIEARNQRQGEPSTNIPSLGALLQVNNNTTRYGSDSSSDIDDLSRINRMDAGVPQG